MVCAVAQPYIAQATVNASRRSAKRCRLYMIAKLEDAVCHLQIVRPFNPPHVLRMIQRGKQTGLHMYNKPRGLCFDIGSMLLYMWPLSGVVADAFMVN